MTRNNKRKIPKHIGNNFNGNTLAFKAIQIQGFVTRDSITYKYDKDTNILIVSDGLTQEKYHTLITDNEIEPFYELIREEL